MEQTTGKRQAGKLIVTIGCAQPFEMNMAREDFLEFILAMEVAMQGLFMEADYIKKHGQDAFEMYSRRN